MHQIRKAKGILAVATGNETVNETINEEYEVSFDLNNGHNYNVYRERGTLFSIHWTCSKCNKTLNTDGVLIEYYKLRS